MKPRASVALLLAIGLCASACLQGQGTAKLTDKSVVAERPFVAGGRIDVQLDGGDYEVQPSADDHIRVTLSGNTGKAKVELNVTDTRADLAVKDTPHNNFHATIEVPKTVDLVVRLSGGNLVMAAITGNKDIESMAGNTEITVGDPSEYSRVDASVKAGDLEASAFGGSKSGLFPRFTWSGPGKYTLRAQLGAGNLELRSK